MGASRHRCTACGIEGPWSEAWSWFGSYRDIEDLRPIAKFCSDACKDAVPEREMSRILLIMGHDPDYVVDPSLRVSAK